MKTESFNERCYAFLRKVPKGKITTYQEIARALGTKAYRAVGNAMNKNPYSYVAQGKVGSIFTSKQGLVPCHRVVKLSGEVGGFASGTKKKIMMLRSEGIEIVDGKVNLKKYLFRFK